MNNMGCAVVVAAIVWGMVQCGRMESAGKEARQIRSAEMAKQGFVEKCGSFDTHDCHWEKAK